MNIARKLKMPQRKLDSLESYLLVISAETFFFQNAGNARPPAQNWIYSTLNNLRIKGFFD